jgi:hypothetical protein
MSDGMHITASAQHSHNHNQTQSQTSSAMMMNDTGTKMHVCEVVVTFPTNLQADYALRVLQVDKEPSDRVQRSFHSVRHRRRRRGPSSSQGVQEEEEGNNQDDDDDHNDDDDDCVETLSMKVYVYCVVF